MKYYYALWIPVKERKDVCVLFNPQHENLHDSWKQGGYHVDGRIDEDSLDFYLQYKSHRFHISWLHSGRKCELHLKCEEKTEMALLFIHSNLTILTLTHLHNHSKIR